jgi:GT2 family glycosyltransferase
VTTAGSVTLLCVSERGFREAIATTQRSVTAQTADDVAFRLVSSLDEAGRIVASASGWVGFLDPGDVVAPHAVQRLLEVAGSSADLVYSDESRSWGNPPSRAPFHKPGWSPDRLRCQPYTGRLALVRAEAARAVGGMRPELSTCAEHDLILRMGERRRGRDPAVAHVPEVLCDRAPAPLSYPTFDPERLDLARRVLDDHLRRTGIPAVARGHETAPGLLRLEPRLDTRPLVSIVIPTAGAHRRVRGADVCLVVNCVRSIFARSTYSELEIVCVVDEGTEDAVRRELADLDRERVRIVDHEGAFHFSRKVNRGVLASEGDVLLMLNDDTEVRTPGWLEAMLLYALEDEVGAVGARLLFDDGRIQHIGVVGVAGNPGHPYHGLAADTVGHGANALVPGNYLAVTGACLMTRRDCFEQVGGMSRWFPENYNDLDYCLKVRATGARVVATPDAVLTHFESSSRSGTVASHELELIRKRWGRHLRDDPFYGPNFPSGIADFEPVRHASTRISTP